ncbi:hypothetical protein LTR97_012912 [Elasticomyces elasticus]|uniref:Transcription factor domain-containing protein n=1 Tax=Elasticomyces elasticus TaxID=574655 RepID=A0AAN7ZXW0_9PEZI|nr:hypothetical protein LTR97_012912 [Elasticomyces elasticus]
MTYSIMGDLNWNNESMDFPYRFWGQEADPWLPELSFMAMEAEPQLQSLAVDSAVERAKPWVLDHLRRRSHPSSPRPREEEKSWYSSPPRLQMYDKEVLNVLLNVARRHLGPTFELFARYEAQNDSESELCLAMAAIGALYLGVECGTTLSKALYNDARRLHFQRFHSSNLQPSFATASATLETFILLSIYGICSGDKRSYEFVEAFHSSMLQALKHYGLLIPADPDAVILRDVRETSEAMELIECYHALILQRPPCATPPQLRSMASLEQNQAAPNPGLPGHAQGLHTSIAGLSTFAWAASCQGEELSCSRQLWRSEFVELAMERWMDERELPLSGSDLPTILIYHLMHLRLKVNLDFLQKSAREFTTPRSQTSSSHDVLENYVRERPFAIAMWHARAMLSMVQASLGVPSNATTPSTPSKRMSEPPHLPYCIYFSTMILWYGEFAKSGYRSLARDACIKQGVRLLGGLKIRVARVFIVALRELLPDE